MGNGRATLYRKTDGTRTGRVTRDPTTRRVLTDQCTDAAPCSVAFSLVGTTLCTGCITGGQVPTGPGGAAWSAKWNAGATNFDFSGELRRFGGSLPAGPPPSPLPQITVEDCCTWIRDVSSAYCGGVPFQNHCLNIYLPALTMPVTPNPACGVLPPFGPSQIISSCFAYLWRSGGNTWNFAIALFDNPFGTNEWIVPFIGSVVSANCMDPFTITNSITSCGSGGILLSGGALSGSPSMGSFSSAFSNSFG